MHPVLGDDVEEEDDNSVDWISFYFFNNIDPPENGDPNFLGVDAWATRANTCPRTIRG